MIVRDEIKTEWNGNWPSVNEEAAWDGSCNWHFLFEFFICQRCSICPINNS